VSIRDTRQKPERVVNRKRMSNPEVANCRTSFSGKRGGGSNKTRKTDGKKKRLLVKVLRGEGMC